jgi:hypothetical protein
LEFNLPCPGTINCDIPLLGRKVKFIAPKGHKIERLRVGKNCPLFYMDAPLSKPKRKHKVRMLCLGTDNTELQAVLNTGDGQQHRTPFLKLKNLKTGGKQVNCKEPKRSFFSRIFTWGKKTKGDLFNKYYLPAS